MSDKKLLFDKLVAEKKLQRIALEIAEQVGDDPAGLLLLGVQKNGVVIAEKLAALLKPLVKNVLVETITLNKQHPDTVSISGDIDFTRKNILLVDDVSNSGRTLMYALKPLLDHFPKTIQTMVLVERMHKQFPVAPDYVGQSVATTKENHIQVEVENGEVAGAFLL
jgi:pyrimidine operon attenuation protein/uracil phosphoribosyltransferase